MAIKIRIMSLESLQFEPIKILDQLNHPNLLILIYSNQITGF